MKIIFIVVVMWSSIFQINGQTDCRYPFEQSADSLVRFVISDIYGLHSKEQISAKFNSIDFKSTRYNSESKVNHDSIFQLCINHLENEIGRHLLCNNIDMYIPSFSISKDQNNFRLSFGFSYPVLKRKSPVNIGTFKSYYERINLDYKYLIHKDGKVRIKFPTNIPNCKRELDCDIRITREKAIEILNIWGLKQEGDNLKMEVKGSEWEISLSKSGWSTRQLMINIHTGKLSNFGISHRID